jgi:hypothetical protein
MKKVQVNYTKRYYKTTTKVVEVPDNEDVDAFLEKNKLELFEDEITAASLRLEEDEIEVWYEEGSREEKDEWFYTHDVEWQNDIEDEFQTDDSAKGYNNHVDWAYDRFHQLLK